MYSIEQRVRYYLGNLSNIDHLNVNYKVIQDSKSYFEPNKLVSINLNDMHLICRKQIQGNFSIYGPNIINIINF